MHVLYIRVKVVPHPVYRYLGGLWWEDIVSLVGIIAYYIKKIIMEVFFFLISGIAFLIAFVLIIRLLGAWMLRIDEVLVALQKLIELQKTTIAELKKQQGGSTVNSSKAE